MSRLADMLSGMDRGTSRPEGVGGIPRLAVPSAAPSSGWRRGLVVGMVVVMCAAGVGLMLRSTTVAPTSIPAPAPSSTSLPAPGLPPRTDTDQQFIGLVGRGLQAAQRGALEESAAFLNEALELKPGDAEVRNSLGVVLARQGDTARGAEAFEQALRVNPSHPEAHRNLAVVLDRQGRSAEAVAHYRAFLRLAATDHAGTDAVRRRLAELSAPQPRE